MLKGSLACEQGTWISHRILHDTIHPSVSSELAHMSSSEGSHILYGSLRKEQLLNWIHPWIQLVWSNRLALIATEISCGVWDIFPQWGGTFYVTATSALTSAECQHHTSSIWPWSGTPKVRLYYTFLGGLRHLPPQMKNEHGLNE